MRYLLKYYVFVVARSNDVTAFDRVWCVGPFDDPNLAAQQGREIEKKTGDPSWNVVCLPDADKMEDFIVLNRYQANDPNGCVGYSTV